MTCIVAVEHEGKIWVGADSIGMDESLYYNRRLDRKIFWNNEYLIGFTGSFRGGQILKHKLELPNFPPQYLPQNFCPEIKDVSLRNLPSELLILVENFFVNEIVDTIKSAFEQGGWANSEDDFVWFLIACGPYMVVIQNDLQVEIVEDYTSIGVAAPLALGALAVTETMGPEERLLLSLAVASKHSAGVTEPFLVDHT
jgi:hypothetical protein